MTDDARPGRRLPLPVMVIGLGLLTGLLILIGTNRRNLKAGLNTPICYDDFVFQVESVKVSDAPSPTQVTYDVTLRVDNKAKRVSFKFDDGRTALLDRAGKAYRPVGPAAITVIPAGSQAAHVIRYVVPREITGPHLKVLASDPVGDALEFLIFGDKEFSLPEPGESRNEVAGP